MVKQGKIRIFRGDRGVWAYVCDACYLAEYGRTAPWGYGALVHGGWLVALFDAKVHARLGHGVRL